MITQIIPLLVVGLIAGAIARLLVPGRDPMGCLGTIALGVAGSFLGGFLADVFIHGTWSSTHTLRPAHFVGSVVGAIILLLVLRMFRGRAF